jgi:putative SOS response-associated peptidase YedK
MSLKIFIFIFMCYSNSSTSTNVQLAERYKKKIPADIQTGPVFFASGFTFPNWRIITSDESIKEMKWGLIPHWFNGEDPKEIAAMTLNSRVETIAEKASFKTLVDRQRCIIPSTGFFEWKAVGKEKVPYFIYPSTDTVFSMAGLWDTWVDPSKGIQINSFSMITCEANPLMRAIHNSKFRMPALLSNEQEHDWLSGKLAHEILQTPLSDAKMKAHEISKKVLQSDHANSPAVFLPFDNGIYEQGSLF